MKKQLLLLVLLIWVGQSFSQLSVFSRYMPYNQKTEVYPVISNPSLGLPLIFFAGKDINIFYIDSKYKYQNEISLKKPAKNSKQYLGSYIVDSSIVINFSNKELTQVSQVSVNLSSDSTQETVIVDLVNQKYLISWETKDGLLVLGIMENSNKFIVTRYFGQGNFSVNEFDFPRLSEFNINTPLSQIFESNNKSLQKINNSIPVSLYLASAKSKAYLVENSIVITLDLFNDATYYMVLDIDSSSCHVERYDYFKTEEGVSLAKNNSYLYESTLFQISFDDDILGLQVQSTKEKAVKSYRLTKGEDILFNNSPIALRNEKEGFLYGDPKIRELNNTKKFFRILSGMNPAITAFHKKLDFQVLLGGVEKIQQSGGVSARVLIASGGKMLVGPGGNLVMPEPDYYFPSNYSFMAYSSCKSVYFSSIVNSFSLAHISKPITRYTYDYIVKYANYMPGRYALVTIFKMKGDYYLGYYSYGSQTYNVEWFKNVDDYTVQY